MESFIHIAQKYLTPEELQGARKYYGDIRYKPGAAATISTAAPTAASKSEEEVVPPEPAPSTAAPAAADSSSEEEEEALQVLASEDSDGELTGIAAALARSSIRAKPFHL